MVSTAEGTIRERSELEGMLNDATGRLRPAHVAALVAHPEAICSALAAADALTDGDGERRSEVETITGPVLPTVDATETGRRLSARARDGAPQRPLTWEELAARTGLKTRQTVHDWRRKSRIVGWQNARPGYVYPAEQLDGRNRPQPALDRVVGLFANGYARVCVRFHIERGPPDALGGHSPVHVAGQGGGPGHLGDDGARAGQGPEMGRAGTR